VVDLHEDIRESTLRRNDKDLSKLDLRNVDLTKTTFDTFTPWPPPDQMPIGFDPNALMEWGKYPGLGLRYLHKQGITGKGVHVAIIDQPLLTSHLEYKDQLASYLEIGISKSKPALHGAVASILAGKTCGVAPEVNLHYWAQPSWKQDYQYRCDALRQILNYNKGKPSYIQIRTVSVSKGFSKNELNLEQWKALLAEAKQKGIYVSHCSRNMLGVGCPAYQDLDDPNNYQLWTKYPNPTYNEPGSLFAPVDNLTTSSHLHDEAYIFWSSGGISWAAPYIAGVVALGLQINPDLSESQIERLLYETGYPYQKGKLINPIGFIEEIQRSLPK